MGAAARWNGRCAEKEAFTNNVRGYPTGCVLGEKRYAHRVIWAMVHGEWPDHIDHINHNKSDNRISNLRSVTHQENHMNRSIGKSNTSGHVGVVWHKKSNKWGAKIVVNGKSKHLGLFTDISDAIAVRAAANIEYNYHENHGVT